MTYRMDVIEAHARRLPPVDGRWTVRPHAREELLAGLRAGKAAGVAAHPLDNVRRNIELLIQQDPDKLFAMTEMPGRLGFALGSNALSWHRHRKREAALSAA